MDNVPAYAGNLFCMGIMLVLDKVLVLRQAHIPCCHRRHWPVNLEVCGMWRHGRSWHPHVPPRLQSQQLSSLQIHFALGRLISLSVWIAVGKIEATLRCGSLKRDSARPGCGAFRLACPDLGYIRRRNCFFSSLLIKIHHLDRYAKSNVVPSLGA